MKTLLIIDDSPFIAMDIKNIVSIDADAKIVMLSSLCDEETMKELEAAGLKYIVEKPIDADALMETFNSI